MTSRTRAKLAGITPPDRPIITRQITVTAKGSCGTKIMMVVMTDINPLPQTNISLRWPIRSDSQPLVGELIAHPSSNSDIYNAASVRVRS